tara:strand:- start:4073 stop:4405 length:333 start_codon:yes stop_codon:yes gene_type:complete
MNLRNKFLNLSKVELIEIAEIHSDYTIEAKNIANQILKEHHNNDFLEELKQYWTNHIKENIKTILMNKKLPKSQFLDENAIKDLVKEGFNVWKEEQELYGIDTTKYWAVF